MQIVQLDPTRRADRRRFVRVPFHLYREDTQWVPPLLSDAEAQINPAKNPFFKRGAAAFFLAVQGGQDLGRIAVLHPKFYNEFKGLQDAFFYLFDAVEDVQVSTALFEQAANWARSQGLSRLRGPLGFLPFDGFGLLAEGFQHRPAIGIPYNAPYYVPLVKGQGFTLEERVFSAYLDIEQMRDQFPERILQLGQRVKERYGFRIRQFRNKREAFDWAAPRLVKLYNETLTHIAGDPPVHTDEAAFAARQLFQVGDLRLIKFVVREDDELVGFLFAYPDISRGLQQARGRLFPLGWAHLLRDFRRTDWLNINGMGILPEYQGAGPSALLYAEIYDSVSRFPQYKHLDIVQISEKNPKMLNDLKNFGVDFYKTHHIYQQSL